MAFVYYDHSGSNGVNANQYWPSHNGGSQVNGGDTNIFVFPNAFGDTNTQNVFRPDFSQGLYPTNPLDPFNVIRRAVAPPQEPTERDLLMMILMLLLGRKQPGQGSSCGLPPWMMLLMGGANNGNRGRGVGGNQEARMWGDPHIVDADGGKYDIQERGIYNVYNDRNMNINAELSPWHNNTTVMTNIGLNIGNQRVRVDKDGNVNINGMAANLRNGQTYNLGNGSTIRKNGGDVVIETPETTITMKANGEMVDDLRIKTRDGGVVNAQGILGETFDADQQERTGMQHHHSHYRVNDLFGTPSYGYNNGYGNASGNTNMFMIF